MEFPAFTKRVGQLLDEAGLIALEIVLARRPEMGVVIPNGGGLRKVRWAAKGHGKSGGARVIYYWRSAAGQIELLAIFAKNEKENLSPAQLAELKKQIGK